MPTEASLKDKWPLRRIFDLGERGGASFYSDLLSRRVKFVKGTREDYEKRFAGAVSIALSHANQARLEFFTHPQEAKALVKTGQADLAVAAKIVEGLPYGIRRDIFASVLKRKKSKGEAQLFQDAISVIREKAVRGRTVAILDIPGQRPIIYR